LAGVAAEVAREIARAQAKAATEALLRSDEARALKEAARSLSGLVSRGIARIGPEAAPRIPATPPGRTAAAMVDAPAEPNKAASPNQAKDAAQSAADRHLTAAVQAAVTVCRHQRGPLSLMLVELDGYGDLAFGVGTSEAGDVLQELEAACAALEHDVVQCVQVRETRFAVLLPLCDRREAVRLGNELLAAQRARLSGNAAAAARLIAGVATVSLPPRNFPPQDLITAATRCLTAAQLYGGDCLKSIEIY
jgi:GGDEF domain-containing protein